MTQKATSQNLNISEAYGIIKCSELLESLYPKRSLLSPKKTQENPTTPYNLDISSPYYSIKIGACLFAEWSMCQTNSDRNAGTPLFNKW